MSAGKFLCYEDNGGNRGYVSSMDSYVLRRVAADHYWVETDSVAFLIQVQPDTEFSDYFFFVSKELDAINWVTEGNSSKAIGVDKCEE
jgi:hypothetical protein